MSTELSPRTREQGADRAMIGWDLTADDHRSSVNR
jgi:hypothetical protein